MRALFLDHGIDVVSRGIHGVPTDVYVFDVLSTGPPKVGVRVELDGDRIVVTLDEAARVVDLTEETGNYIPAVSGVVPE